MKNNYTAFLLAASLLISAIPFIYLKENKINNFQSKSLSTLSLEQGKRIHKITSWEPENESEGDENPAERYEWELMRTADPETGQIPDNIRALELAFAKTLPAHEDIYEPSTVLSKNSSGWLPRGPYNVGGRTRAVALDVNNENIMLAGGATGGMWRSTNGGQSWSNTTLAEDLKSVSCVVQDKRPGKTNTWYYGTGEYTGGYVISGDGIFKSIDSGKTWKQMLKVNKPQSQQYTDYIWNIAPDNSNVQEDEIYIAAYGGIYRSTNGGENISLVLGGGKFGINSTATDVLVTSTGVVYAALSGDGPNGQRGLWRSENGINWVNITPVGWPSGYGRVVMALAPTNENALYFLASTPGNGAKGWNWDKTRSDYNSFWKYNYISGTGKDSGGTWENRSANLPLYFQQEGHIFGDFSSQGGYDLIVKVKPDDENILFIGGTNLFRSTNGFATKNNTSWIGGYNQAKSIIEDYTYTNHHPDQHNLVFYPSNPNKMLSSHDGGMSVTNNCLAPQVSWDYINNGYITTQFYSVAINQDPKHNHPHSDVIMGGLQDNQTWLTQLNSASNAEWEKWTRGDGGYCAIADNDTATFMYTAIQLGRIFKYTFDKDGNLLGWNRIDPAGATGYLFINPYVLDAANSNKMYTAAGEYIWRNDDLASIPLTATNDTTSIGWKRLENSRVSGNIVTTLTSAPKSLHTLYFGTYTGKLYRIDNADNGDPVKKDISNTLFANRYISNIAIDPKDAEKIIVVVSNYNSKSLFYSADGGKTFTDISGNLEESADGRGNGPSCRNAKIVQTLSDETMYFVGTSTGLYMTKKLDGLNTTWVQEGANSIGNAMVEMIATRQKDGMIVAATYGSGVFSADYNIVASVKEKQNPQPGIISSIFPNPAKEFAMLQLMLPNTETLTISISDINGKEVLRIPAASFLSGKNNIKLNLEGLKNGVYFCNVQSGKSISSKKFLVIN